MARAPRFVSQTRGSFVLLPCFSFPSPATHSNASKKISLEYLGQQELAGGTNPPSVGLMGPYPEPQEGNQSQTRIGSKYSKTLQSRTPAKKSLQQASNARPRGTGEAVGHDKSFGGEDSDSLDGIGEE